MLEAGWPLHHIQHMLGHASLEQTSTYLNVEKTGLQDSMRRFGVPGRNSLQWRCNPGRFGATRGGANRAAACR